MSYINEALLESERLKQQGGKRVGSGRKKADYKTKTIAFRVRVEFVEPIKKMVKDYVSERLQGDA
jgi:hypothetical protein